MRKPTIKGLVPDVRVSRWAVQDDTYAGAWVAYHPDHLFVFVWPYRADGQMATRIAVKDMRGMPFTGRYLEFPTVADVMAYDQEAGKIIVPAGPAGIARAVARWIKESS